MDGADADLVLGLGLRGAEAPHHPEPVRAVQHDGLRFEPGAEVVRNFLCLREALENLDVGTSIIHRGIV